MNEIQLFYMGDGGYQATCTVDGISISASGNDPSGALGQLAGAIAQFESRGDGAVDTYADGTPVPDERAS